MNIESFHIHVSKIFSEKLLKNDEAPFADLQW